MTHHNPYLAEGRFERALAWVNENIMAIRHCGDFSNREIERRYSALQTIHAIMIPRETPRTEELRKLVSDQAEYGSVKEKRVVCAACRWPDGHVILGIRHFSPDMLLSANLQGYDPRDCREQGFVDQYGAYLTRQEAYKIAEANGQYKPYEPFTPGTLYSEDLY